MTDKQSDLPSEKGTQLYILQLFSELPHARQVCGEKLYEVSTYTYLLY